MKTVYSPWACFPLAIAVACAAAPAANAQDADAGEPEVIVVGPDRGTVVDVPGVRVRVVRPDGDEAPPEAAATPEYWIGVALGAVSPELRMHLGLPDAPKAGVMVVKVTPDSPAAGAGLRAYDILVAANGQPLATGSDLVRIVAAAGPANQPIELEIIRRGEQQTLTVTPAERRSEAAPRGLPNTQPHREAEQSFLLRLLGPGTLVRPGDVLGGFGDLSLDVNGTLVQVTQEDGQIRVKVQRGDETWEVDATDPEAVEGLPADIRGIVEGFVRNLDQEPRAALNLDQLPGVGSLFAAPRFRDAERGASRTLGPSEEVERRLEELQQQIDEIKRRLEAGEEPAAIEIPAEDPPA